MCSRVRTWNGSRVSSRMMNIQKKALLNFDLIESLEFIFV